MKIKYQEHYEKTIKYAESIGDETLKKCIERLKQWEVNSNGRYEIELYYDSSPYSFGFAEVAKDGTRGVVGGFLYHGKPDQSFAVIIVGPFHEWSIITKKGCSNSLVKYLAAASAPTSNKFKFDVL